MLDLCKMSQYLTKIIQVEMCYVDKVRGANATLGNPWKSLVTFSTVHRLWACLWHHLEFIRFLYNLRECGCQNHTFDHRARGGGGRGGHLVFFGWVCATRDSKLAPRSRKKFP